MHPSRSRRRAASAALVAVLTLLTAFSAQAAQRGAAVAVPLEPKLESRASTISYVLQTVLRQSSRLENVDLAEEAQGPAAQARVEKVKEARLAYNRARRAYDELDLEVALAGFEQAMALFQETDLSQNMAGLLDAIAMHAATRFFNGDVKAARDELARLISLKPNFVFDERTFSPPLRQMAEEIRGEVAVEAEAPLEVQARPVPGRVYVNGVFVGISPQELKRLAPTDHHITVVAPGYELVQERHRAGPGRIAKVQLKPAANGQPLVAGMRDLQQAFKAGDVSRPAAGLARWARADEILVAGVSRAGSGMLSVALARVAADGHVLAVGSKAIAEADPKAMGELAAFASQLFQKDLPRGPRGAPVAARISIGGGMGRATWGYVSAGAAAAAALGGTLFALQAQDVAGQAKAIPQVEADQIRVLTADARGKAMIADGLFAASAIGVGVTLWLVLPTVVGGEPSPTGGDDDIFSILPTPLPDGGGFAIIGRF